MEEKHFPVMLDEVINNLQINPRGVYVDLTLGRGGHSEAILKKLSTGFLYAFDKDLTAINESSNRLSKANKNFKLIHSDFKNFKSKLAELKVEHVDGIIMDLGVSSPQLDQAERGFSYSKDSKLDMRMDTTQEFSAYDVVNGFSVEELAKIFKDYADVKLSLRVAKGIVLNRPIDTTLELVKVIRESLPQAVVRQKNPAKAIFQAIRIAVNNELDSLKIVLQDAPKLLNSGGSIEIITFHSIEDKIVKLAFKEYIVDETGSLPIIVEKQWSAKSFSPSKYELELNSRSRSAKLRVLRKL